MKALKYAAAFAERFGAKLTLLHVIEPIAMPDFAATYPLVMDPNEVAKISKQKLDSLAGQFEINPDLVEKVLVRSGAPFNEISTAARGLKADLIIISTHGRTGLKHLVLGSTTERVVRHADCPVFVVREQEREFI
jgi:nucleotide-binding universal stress UspA family protein